MKISLQFFLSILFSLNLFGQNFKISVDNPIPRLGDEIELKLNINIFDDLLKDKLPPGIAIGKKSPAFNDEAKTVIQVKKKGKFKIGPFDFEFQGKYYKSDSIELLVLDSIGRKEGVWINYAKLNGSQVLVIDQQIYGICEQ